MLHVAEVCQLHLAVVVANDGEVVEDVTVADAVGGEDAGHRGWLV